MKFAIGVKKGMSQIFSNNGEAIPITIVNVEKNFITQIKTLEKDKYSAVQVGSIKTREKLLKKPELARLKEIAPLKHLKEFRLKEASNFKVGQEIKTDIFSIGDKVICSGLSKGKGFQGVVKRWGFSGSPKTHGTKHTERAPGSIGSINQARVNKGKKMAGRMGFKRISVKNLEIVAIENDYLYIKGALPGRRGTLIEIKSIE